MECYVIRGGDLFSAIHRNFLEVRDAIGLAQDQDQQAEQYNKKRIAAPAYVPGDLVYLNSDGINRPSYATSPRESIPFGPLEISRM
jgi:hypothetical protein